LGIESITISPLKKIWNGVLSIASKVSESLSLSPPSIPSFSPHNDEIRECEDVPQKEIFTLAFDEDFEEEKVILFNHEK